MKTLNNFTLHQILFKRNKGLAGHVAHMGEMRNAYNILDR
jgi:hypothetical protein